MLRKFLGIITFISLTVNAAPTAYLPIGADNYLQDQVDHLFLLTSGNPMKKPYSIASIDHALNQIESTDPSLYQAVNNGLEPYRANNSVGRAGFVVRHSVDEEMPIGNQRGLSSEEYLQAFAEGSWRPNDYTVVQAGAEYRADANTVVPYNTFVGFSKGNLQLDLGYREHWYSPFSFSSQLISNNAEMGPSITLSTVSPIERFWQANFELFYTRLDKVKNGVKYLDQWYDGSPHLIGTHLSLSPTESWTLGFNRILQFGGGPREVSSGDIVKAFFDPAANDNSDTTEERATEFGDQMASVTSSYRLNADMPIEIYAELA
ncbi:MAG: capsule assembly Wzi family protein, partial [Porticoccaceae bacterium]